MPFRPFRSRSGHPLVRNYVRFGIACTALLYVLMGALTAMAALGLGGEKADHKDVMPFLHHQPFGRFLIGFLVVGLGGYVLWRLYQAFADPGDYGNDPKGLFIRFGLLVSAFFYGGLTWYGIRLLAEGGRADKGEEGARVAGALLKQDHGSWWVWLVSGIFLALGLVQFYRVFSGKFKRRIKDPGTSRRHPDLIKWTGTIGFSARGVVLLVVSYLFWRAGHYYRASEAGGTERALAFLESVPFGSLLLAMVAAGLAAYGVFLAVQAVSIQDDLAG